MYVNKAKRSLGTGLERSAVMRQQFTRTLAVCAFAAGSLLGGVGGASAQTVSAEQAAGLIVFPRIVSDPDDIFQQGASTETVVQLTNTDAVDAHVVHCFYVNATGLCSTGNNEAGTVGAECRDADDCLGSLPTCDPRWSPNNFNVVLSPNQTIGIVASQGLSVPAPGDGSVPPVSTQYFVGELKCIEVDGDSIGGSNVNPIAANDIIGTATIYISDEGDELDVRSYTAIGVQATGNNDAEGDKVLCLGGNGIVNDACEDAEYAACPAKLSLNNWFEGASYSSGVSGVSTSVTFAPCSEDFTTDTTTPVTVQILVYNEFEQRMSASTRVECLTRIDLADISNIFDATVQGTLTGQTTFRPVASGTAGEGVGLLAIAEETILGLGRNSGSNAYSLAQSGIQQGVADVVQYIVP